MELGTIWAEVERESTPSAKNSRKRGMGRGSKRPAFQRLEDTHGWLLHSFRSFRNMF